MLCHTISRFTKKYSVELRMWGLVQNVGPGTECCRRRRYNVHKEHTTYDDKHSNTADNGKNYSIK